ncbi:MAG: metallophosphoesterase family protein [Bacteroidota bacterium]|nr:metallophosphoesterase family protein [Bacteroidota bacterium]|tara:strand:+ start:519 stop:1004 length:486 start_codon:yes stop_codon:yes gene_type:complete
MKIGVISDTHSYFHEDLRLYLKECDEIWHAGDVGNIETLKKLEKFKKFRGVFGNIDNDLIRRELSEIQLFTIENLKFLIIHIAGKPPKYNKYVRELIDINNPNIIICGHSHILKIERDKVNNLLYINPGACGKIGFHKRKTIVRFRIERGNIDQLEVIELS